MALAPEFWRVPCQLAKRKVLFFRIGPPSVPPYIFRRSSGVGWLGRRKKLRASTASLRRNSKAVPWILLVPERMVAFTTAPAEWPYSAEYVLVSTLNSISASTEGWMTTLLLFERSGILALLSIPSRMKLFISARVPLATNAPPVLGAVAGRSRLIAAGWLSHADREFRQVEIVASVQRQLSDRLGLDNLTHGGIAALQH